MNKQEKILVWLRDNEEDLDLPLETGKLHEKFQEQEDYSGKHSTFSEMLRKLYKKKELLDNPEYGKYELSERGKNKADYLLNPDEQKVEKPEGYKDVLDDVANYISYEAENKLSQAVRKGESFKLKFSELESYNFEILEWIEGNPDEFLELLQEVKDEVSMSAGDLGIEPEVDVGYFELSLSEARNNENIEEIITTEAMVESSSEISPEVVSATFECAECGQKYEKDQDSAKLKSPYKCECSSKKFEPIDKTLKDVKEFSLSTQTEQEDGLEGYIKEDKLGEEIRQAFTPGRKVRVTGILRGETKNSKSKKLDLKLDVISFKQMDREVTREDFGQEEINEVKEKVQKMDNPFEEFAKGIAPTIRDALLQKKVVSAGLIGGVPAREGSDDGRIHVAIYGNPGTGKSAIQEYIQETFSNTYYADNNATGVGLTATVESQDDGDYKIRAGKLVYADKGVLSVDEIDKIEKTHLGRLNTAMERGYFPMDKASQNVEIPGRATVISTGNFTEELDFEDGDYLNRVIDFLPETVQGWDDRFSLKCAVRKQNVQKKWESMANRYQRGAEEKFQDGMDQETQVIFRQLAKDKTPLLSDESKEVIDKYLNGELKIADSKDGEKRKIKPKFKSQSSRILRTIIQLTLMQAKCRLADKTDKEDSVRAIKLFNACRNSLDIGDGEPLTTTKDSGTTGKEMRIQKVVRRKSEKLLKETHSDNIEKQDLIEEVKSSVDASEEDVEEVLKSMENKGEIYKPEPGKVQKL